ncbi:MAG: hypothetical protein K2J95_00545, partial [Lachnospiraceae bacterium]|nr:hypothetical protein [Lachnospiraceae bacterium]
NMMAEADQAMAEASEVIAEIASLTERIPSHIRCNDLLDACVSAQAEIKSVDFLSYGQKVDQGLQNLLDHNQYITEHFIKNMEMHTEKMRGLGEEFRRLTDSITYCGKSEHTEGMSSVVYSGESEHTEGMSSIDDESETERIDRIIENLPTRDGLLRQAAAKMAGITLNEYGAPVTDDPTDYNSYLYDLREGKYSYGEIAKILTGSINSKYDMEIYQKYLNWLKPVGYLAYDREGSITQNEEEGFYVIYSIPTLDSSYDQYHMSDIYDEIGMESFGALQAYCDDGSKLNTNGNHTYGGQSLDKNEGTLMYNGIPRYAVALGPTLQNPNFNFENNGIGLTTDKYGRIVIDVDYMSYGTCVDVVIIEDSVPYFIPAIIVDVKEHTYPSGLVQTYENFNHEVDNPNNAQSGNIVEWYHFQYENNDVNNNNRSNALRSYNKDASILIYREEVLQ